MQRRKIGKLCALLIPVLSITFFSSISVHASESEEPVRKFTPIPEGFTRYEAEDGNVVDGEIKGKVEQATADYGTYSGLGFVGCLDYPTSRVDFLVETTQSGNYQMNVGYAISADFGSATFAIYVDDIYYSSVSLSKKYGWGAFFETPDYQTSINLNQGVNKVSFIKGYNHAELDYIDIGKRNGPFIDPSIGSAEIAKVPEGFTRYEAETQKINSGRIYTTGTFSGTGYVGDLDYSGVSKIDFEVEVESRGEYDLHLAYAIGEGFEPASFKVYNTHGLYTTIRCDKQFGWGSFELDAIVEAKISLEEGKNIISIYKSVEFAQIDFIDISDESTGEWKESDLVLNYPNYDSENYTRYEMEDQLVINASPKGVAYIFDIGTYSGKGYVGSLNNDNCYIEVPIHVEQDGEYEILLAYACVETGASLRLYSGSHGRGGNVYFDKEVFFENVSEDWGEFSDQTIYRTTINLKSTDDFIIILSGLIRAEIDYLDFGSKVGEYHELTYAAEFDRHNPKGE